MKNNLVQEIVIALTAPIGVDLTKIKEIFQKETPAPYQVEYIQLSTYFKDTVIKIKEEWEGKKDDSGDKEKKDDIERLLKSIKNYSNDKKRKIAEGNLIVAYDNLSQKKEKNNKMAEIAISEIAKDQHNSENKGFPKIYLIQSLKRLEEIELLKHVYGRAFYLLGFFSDDQARKDYLEIDKTLTSCDIKELMETDKSEDFKYGQKVRKTFPKSDYFIHYDLKNIESTKKNIERFLGLILNDQFITPRKEEIGMSYAYVASMRSGDLSRQVGAAIVDKDGAVLSVGTNDVPKAGGDLYWEEDEFKDRDIEERKDSNDLEKMEVARDLIERISKKKKKINDEDLRKILEDSKLDNLLEFGRAVHAETDAIVSAARRGVAIKGATLYTTTFPCHLCIKNIIDSGVETVAYIYPYPKSKAFELHKDAIKIPPETGNVLLRPYEGVSPTRLFDLFTMKKRKEDDGILLPREKPAPRLERDIRGEEDREKDPV